MNKYRKEFEEKHGIQLRGADESTIIYYTSWLESKLEQAEREKKELVELLRKVDGLHDMLISSETISNEGLEQLGIIELEIEEKLKQIEL